MDLKTYLAELSPRAKEQFATRSGTTVDYLKQLSGNHRKPSVDLAKAMVVASGNHLKLEDLRPDIWGDINVA